MSLLEPDPSLGASWVPIRIDVDGLITDKKVDRAIRIIEEWIGIGSVNFVLRVYRTAPVDLEKRADNSRGTSPTWDSPRFARWPMKRRGRHWGTPL